MNSAFLDLLVCARRAGAVAAVLLVAAVSPLPAWAEDPPAPAASDPASNVSPPAVRALLLERGSYWTGKYRPELALEIYRQLLDLAPDDPAGLAGAAGAAMAVFNPWAADVYLAKLRAVAPADSRLAKLQRQRDRTPEQLEMLADARRLAATGGHSDEAIAAYRKMMPDGKVPDELAAEFYPLLIASLPDQSVDANDALTAFGAVAAKSPDDDNLQLSYALAMIVQESTRADGFEKLHALAKTSSVASEARKAWRTALLWQGADFAAQAQLETYLSENPSDPELDAKREEFRASLPSPGAWARMNAYEAMRANHMPEAEKLFQKALAYDAKDVDAMIMIAAIRLQAGKKAEAHSLAEQAVALAPDRKQELLGIVGEDPEANAGRAAAAARAVAGQYEAVDRLAKQGGYDQAEEKLRRLIGARPNAGDLLHLADIQIRAGHLEPAAATLRKVLDREPKNADADMAMAALLTRQGHAEDAAGYYAKAEDEYLRSGNHAGLEGLRQSRAADIRARAEAAHDPAVKLPLLRSALAIDPSDPWLRLELARMLRKTGAATEAQEVMLVIRPDAGAAAKPGTANVPRPATAAVKPAGRRLVRAGAEPDGALQAGFIWAEERDDVRQAAAFADHVPASARSPQMIDAQFRAALAEQIRQAIVKTDAAGTRRRLVALAGQPDPDGRRGFQIGEAALHAGDKEGAERIVYAGLDSTRPPTPAQRLRYAAILLAADAPVLAGQLVDGIRPDQLPADQRSALPQVLDDVASARADDLTKQGHLAEAYKVLAPRLAENPRSTRLNLSLSRWQIASGHPDAALAISETVVKQVPGDVWAHHAAIEAAVAARELGQAQAMVADALKKFPDDPYLLMQAGTVAQARDEGGVALDYMKKAKTARARQLAANAATP